MEDGGNINTKANTLILDGVKNKFSMFGASEMALKIIT